MADELLTAWMDERAMLLFLDLGIYETLNVLVRRLGRTADEVAVDMGLLFDLELELINCDRELAVLAARVAAITGLSGYDAAFVASASILSVPLITTDSKILEAAPLSTLALSSLAV
jgi:predicted nucleic acid-binding protein